MTWRRTFPQQQGSQREGHGVEPLRVGQRAHHRGHEGVRPGALERTEVVPEAGARDRLQRQLGHVAGHVHRPARSRRPVPVLRQPPGDVQHHRVVAGHGVAAEPGREHLVGQLPVRLVVVRREQAVPGDRPQIGHAEPHVLGEPRLVREVGRLPGTPHEHELLAERLPPEHRPQLAGVAQRVLQGSAPVHPQHVAEEGDPARRMRDAVQLRPAQFGTPETLGLPGPYRRLGHDAISLDPAAGSHVLYVGSIARSVSSGC